jgi:murein DD-endopeptidase MepM/ murein hydrolase activator NlpD
MTTTKLKYSLTFFALSLLFIHLHADEWVFPVGNPNSNEMRITQEYMNYLSSQGGHHVGLDIGRGRTGNRNYTPNNKTIRSVARGRVIYVGTGDNHGWGNTIVIRHDFLSANRYIFTSYSHMEGNSLKVEENEVVQAGQPIGTMGSTGNSTATHLHFMVFTTDNGESLWNDFTWEDLGDGYIGESQTDAPYVEEDTVFYNPLLFLKFARVASISPVSIKNYSINGDSPLNSSPLSPYPLKVGNNDIRITLATYRHDLSLSLSIRNYAGGTVGGEMSLVNRDGGGWTMSNDYSPLGNDVNNNGWNKEYILTYRHNFNLSANDSDGADIAVFWKPHNYSSSKLILPIPGGNAYNTISNSGRYVHREVE